MMNLQAVRKHPYSRRVQAKKEFFFPSHPPSRKVLKHPGWWNIATEAICSTLVLTTRGDRSTQIQKEENRPELVSSQREDTGH